MGPLHPTKKSEKLWPRCTNPPPTASSSTVCRPNLVVEALPDSLTSTTVLTTSRKTKSDSDRSELASLKKIEKKARAQRRQLKNRKKKVKGTKKDKVGTGGKK